MSVRSIIFALAAVAAASLMTGAAISPAMAQTAESVTVSFGDLNLASQAGRDVLYRRVSNAAREVCGNFALRELKLNAMSRACRADAIADARTQLARVIVSDDYAAIRVSRAAI